MNNNTNHVENPLGTEKISNLLIKFSIPAIVGMTVNAIYNIVDRIYIGNAPDIGSNGIAGVTIAFPIMIILLSIGLLFGTGGAIWFSINLGEKKFKEAKEIVATVFLLLTTTGLVFTVFGQIFLEKILIGIGASQDILPYSMEYMRVIFWGAIFQVTNIGMNNILRADGKPNLAMITMFLGAGVNIILDPVFIYVFDMGIGGAAFATILSQCISTIWIVAYFFTDKTKYKIEKKYLKFYKHHIIKITILGIPAFISQVGNSILNIVLNRNLFAYGGDVAIAGMGIINSVQTMLIMPVLGLMQGTQPIISYNFGAKKYMRIVETEKIAMTTATIICFLGWIIIQLFSKEITMMFNQETELVTFTSRIMKTWFLFLPVIGFQILGANFFQSTGRSILAILLTMSRQIILLIPAIIIFSNIWGLNGIICAAPFADGFSALITGVFFFVAIRKFLVNKPNILKTEVPSPHLQ